MNYNKLLIIGIIIVLLMILHKLTNNNIKYFVHSKFNEFINYIKNFSSSFTKMSIRELLTTIITNKKIFTQPSENIKNKSDDDEIHNIKQFLKKKIKWYKLYVKDIEIDNIYYFNNIKGKEFIPFNTNIIISNNNNTEKYNINISLAYSNNNYHILNLYINNSINEKLETDNSSCLSTVDIESINMSTENLTLSSNI
jgi:hypothetical protein